MSLSKQGNRILLVDDNESVHQDYKKILQTEAEDDEETLISLEEELFGKAVQENQDEKETAKIIYRLDDAYQGEEAYAMVETAELENDPYSLVFMDVRMPSGMDGITAIKKIWTKYPNIEMVICTAYSDYSWEEIMGQVGVTDKLLFVKKPFNSTAIQQMALTLTTKWTLNQKSLNYISDLEKEVARRTEELNQLVGKLKNSNEDLEESLQTIQSTQKQLVIQQRLATLGSLIAGISQDNQAPTSSISNLADLSTGILQELQEENQEGESEESSEEKTALQKEQHKKFMESIYQFLSGDQHFSQVALFHEDQLTKSKQEDVADIQEIYQKWEKSDEVSIIKQVEKSLIFIPMREFGNYVFVLQSSSPLSKFDEEFLKNLVNQAQVIHQSQFEIVKHPQLLFELHTIASRIHEIILIKSENRFSHIYEEETLDQTSKIIYMPLKNIKLYFDDTLLLQVHRSYLINPKKVVHATKLAKFKFELKMESFNNVPIGKSYLPILRKSYPDWFTES